jgi:hypothetical protein
VTLVTRLETLLRSVQGTSYFYYDMYNVYKVNVYKMCIVELLYSVWICMQKNCDQQS